MPRYSSTGNSPNESLTHCGRSRTAPPFILRRVADWRSMTSKQHPSTDPAELSRDHLLAVIDRLPNHSIMVIGDAILDEYLLGRADRLSREAPVPVLEFERRDLILGGAANPSANIVSLGSKVI